MAGAESGGIFISYRRDETEYPASWLYDRIVARFGFDQVFKDVDSIELGEDFAEAISSAVETCDVLLALIGKDWLTITDIDGRRRLDDPNDFVRLEIEAALARNVRVIPILIGGVRMPRAEQMPVSLGKLARRQGFELSSIRFQSDVDRLLPNLEKALAVEQARREAAKKSDPATKTSAPRARKVRETSGAGRSPTNLSTTLPTILRTEARGLLGADLGDVQDVVKWIDQTTWPDDPRECANIIRGKMFVDPDIASHGPLYMAMLNALRNVSESST